ncbi:MAG: aldehyde dehydrogenase family protein, partial [Nocardioidaceae bacterium]|nr:aldehyde dehydrogenase family protein [Nocardioidaceae bacterium]
MRTAIGRIDTILHSAQADLALLQHVLTSPEREPAAETTSPVPPLVTVRAAIDAAAAAFDGWAGRTAYERSAALAAAHRLMLERKEALAQLMTREQGKPLRMARNEVGYAADFLSWFAEEAKRNYGETIPSARADQRFLVLHQPVGVVGAITPCNYPIKMLTRKIAPALAAGCTVVLK